MLSGRWGDVARPAEAAGRSRQIAYRHARRVPQAVAPQDGDGPTRQGLRDEIPALRREDRQLGGWLEPTVESPKAKRRHFAAVAAAMGLSPRQIARLRAILRPAVRCPGHAAVRRWIHREAVQAGGLLKRRDRAGQAPVVVACLDEIVFPRRPVSVAVEPRSMAGILGQRTSDRSGPTGAAALQGWTAREAVLADGGTGWHAGLARIPRPRHASHHAPLGVGLDVSHTPRDAPRLWRSIGSRAAGVWTPAEAADGPGTRDPAWGQDARGAAARARRAWGRARAASHHAEAVPAAGPEITAALQVFGPDGRWNAPSAAEARVARAIPRWSGADRSQVIRSLLDPRSVLVRDRSHRPLQGAAPDEPRRAAGVRRWWRRRRRPRGRSASAAGGAAQGAHLVQRPVGAGLGADRVEAYRRGSRALGSTWLDLKRRYWNCRVFDDGKRRGRCPYEPLGLKLPSDDPWELLRRSPEDLKLPEEVSTSELAA